jgi:hypothetical protein
MDFVGPPSAVIANGDSQYVPTPGDGSLATENSHTHSTTVTTSLRALPLPQRAETSFEKVPLFTINAEEDADEMYTKVYSLPYLNHILRQAAKADERMANAPPQGRKRTSPEYSGEALFQNATIASVSKSINYIGYEVAGVGNVAERTQGWRIGRYRVLTSQLQGPIDHVPNIFLPQVTYIPNGKEGFMKNTDPRLQQGDAVGFMIKRVAYIKDSDDNDMEKMPEDVIQVVGVAGPDGSIPFGNTGDEETEGNTYDIVQGAKRFVPAVFIPVGRVERVTPHLPAPDAKMRAMRNNTSYEFMKTRLQTVDLQLGIRYPTTWAV